MLAQNSLKYEKKEWPMKKAKKLQDKYLKII